MSPSIKQVTEPALITNRPAPLDQLKLEEYTGNYYSQEVDSKLTISLQDEQLIITPYSKDIFVLVPKSVDSFRILNSKVIVDFDRQDGKHHRVTLYNSEGQKCFIFEVIG
ncbi:DUF3471 domain-containing protein [Pedobacter rhizosphaerae]|uniref:Peptidase S12 Pab87-related C-terminal domain-containing protein n=1 Tax=Pedobacter rhizosphaerae TaxID=390241 RepID=A0A1H9PMP2_9SPHI|nr:protein of unknown function [Pedobacter rhizosphaerae]